MSAYGPLAASYDRLTRDVPYGEILAFAQMLLTERGLRPRSVLDLACGTGAMSLLLAKAGYQVTGVDLSEEMLTVAYDKAVEVVTDKVREQTQLEDLEVIEKYRKSVVSPNAKNSPEVVKIANTLLGRAREKLQQSAEKILKKVQAVLLKPEVKQAGKEQIKKKARESIKEKLAKGKLDADRKNRERWEREGRIAPTKKQDMEL